MTGQSATTSRDFLLGRADNRGGGAGGMLSDYLGGSESRAVVSWGGCGESVCGWFVRALLSGGVACVWISLLVLSAALDGSEWRVGYAECLT